MTEQREPIRPDDWREMTPGEKARWFDEHPIEQKVEAAPELNQESSEQEDGNLAPVGAKLEQRNQGMTGIRRLYTL